MSQISHRPFQLESHKITALGNTCLGNSLRFMIRHCAKVIALARPHIRHLLRLVLLSGPKILLTSRISLKCAVVMVSMCVPALLYCATITIAGLLFQSPQQGAYFYFARSLNEGPARWGVLLLTGLCAILSLAMPATMAPPRNPDA